MDHAHLHLLLRQLGDLVRQRLERSGHVRLHDQVERLLARLRALEHVLEGHLHALAARERLGLQAVGAVARERAGLALVLDHPGGLARLGHAVEAEHLDGLAGRGLLDALAAEVVHRAHAAPVGAGHEGVAHVQRAALDRAA